MEKQVRRAEYAEITRAAIISAALQLFAERGYEATNLDDVGTASRASKGAIYHHFRSKRDLFEAVLSAITDLFVEQVKQSLADRPCPTLPYVLSAYLDASADPAFAQLVLREGPPALGWEGWRRFSRANIVTPFGNILATCTPSTLGLKDLSELGLQTLVAGLNEMSVAVLDSPDRALARQEAATLINALVESLTGGTTPGPAAR